MSVVASEATLGAGDEVDGTAGGPEVSGWDMNVVASEATLGAGDVDRDARPDVLGTLGIRLP